MNQQDAIKKIKEKTMTNHFSQKLCKQFDEMGLESKKTYCQLTQEEIDNIEDDEEYDKCSDPNCFDCYGDTEGSY